MEKEVELKIPRLVIDEKGKITPFVRGFLTECFGYSEASIFYTTWVYGPGHLAYDRYKPNAITWFNRVYYSPQWREESSFELWFRYVVHEQRHRYDIHTVGSRRFYFKYLREYRRLIRDGFSEHDAYMGTSWEKKAYGDEDKMTFIIKNTDFSLRVEEFTDNIDSLEKGKNIGVYYKNELLKMK